MKTKSDSDTHNKTKVINIKITAAVGIILVFCLFFATNSNSAGKQSPKPPGLGLNIVQVSLSDPYDIDPNADNYIEIFGEMFNTGPGPLVVKLGTSTLNCELLSATIIECDIDNALAPGEYLLTVSRGTGQSENDEFDVTVPPQPIPAGTIAFFAGDCPPGWSDLPDDQRGFAIVTTPPLGTDEGTVGSAFTDLENRAHNHTIDPSAGDTTVTGSHFHSGETGGGDFELSAPVVPIISPSFFSLQIHHHLFNTELGGEHSHTLDIGETATSNATTSQVIPYIQLRACSKDV